MPRSTTRFNSKPPSEEIQIRHMPASPLAALPHLLEKVRSLAADQEVHLVGGALRDSLLGLASHDFDFVVAGDAVGLARRIADRLRADFYVLDDAFGAARIIVTGEQGVRDVLDFSPLRGRHIVADLEARDFTINAMALNLRDGTTSDPLQGAADIRAKTIRACSPSALHDDPIRILRAVRLAGVLDFRIDGPTRKAIKISAELLPNTSPERQRDELFKMLAGRRPESSMRALDMLGILPHVLPELGALTGSQLRAPHTYGAWEHTLSVMRHLREMLEVLMASVGDRPGGLLVSTLRVGLGRYQRRLHDHFSAGLNQDRPLGALLQFAVLYHDVGSSSTLLMDKDDRAEVIGSEAQSARLARERAVRFGLSRLEIARLHTIVAHHSRFLHLAKQREVDGQETTRREIYHFFRDVAEAGVDLVLLGLADMRGTRDTELTEGAWSGWVRTARTLLENYWERPEEAVAPPRLLDGHDLMKTFSLPAGPLIGQLMEAIRETQAAGQISSREDALSLARRCLEQLGLPGRSPGESPE